MTPTELCPDTIKQSIKKPNAIPKNPAKYPSIIYINLNIFRENLKALSGIANEQIPAEAIIIIRIGLTILAETAASPKISAPIIPYSSTKCCRNTNTSFLD